MSNSANSSDSGRAPRPVQANQTLQRNRRLLFGVMAAVTVWGSLLALGAFLFGYDEAAGSVRYAPNVVRGLIVLACVAVFVGGWAGLLVVSRRG